MERGRSHRFGSDARELICEAAKAAPRQAGCPFTTWSLTKLVEHLREQHRLWVSTDTVRTILREAGITWQATKTWKGSRDPDFIPKKARILDLYDQAVAGQMLKQDLTQPSAPDHDPTIVAAGEVIGEFAHAPMRERRTPPLAGRAVAVATMNRMSASLIRRGRPPAHLGSSAANPRSLKAWITSLTVSSSAATSFAIAETGVPDDDAITIMARRVRIVPCLPRRTIWVNRRPSSSVSLRALTGSAIRPRSATRSTVETESEINRTPCAGPCTACRQPGERSWSPR
jgi:hypothetical protein